MLYIIKNDYFLTDFVLEALSGIDQVRVIAHRRRRVSALRRSLKYVEAYLGRRRGRTAFFDADYVRELSAVTPRDAVLFFGVEDLKDLLILRRLVATDRLSLWLWNPLSSVVRDRAGEVRFRRWLDKAGITPFTFDPDDARRAGLHLLDQVYRPVDTLASDPAPPPLDVFFVGREKGRLALLTHWKNLLLSQGLRVDFHIVPERRVRYSPAERAELRAAPLAYAETLATIARSNALLEIVQPGQSGLSIRALEAFFFGRKLLTNNAWVARSPLYDPRRVFLIGRDDPSRVPAFLAGPAEPPPAALLARHDIRQWCRRFGGFE